MQSLIFLQQSVMGKCYWFDLFCVCAGSKIASNAFARSHDSILCRLSRCFINNNSLSSNIALERNIAELTPCIQTAASIKDPNYYASPTSHGVSLQRNCSYYPLELEGRGRLKQKKGETMPSFQYGFLAEIERYLARKKK